MNVGAEISEDQRQDINEAVRLRRRVDGEGGGDVNVNVNGFGDGGGVGGCEEWTENCKKAVRVDL